MRPPRPPPRLAAAPGRRPPLRRTLLHLGRPAEHHLLLPDGGAVHGGEAVRVGVEGDSVALFRERDQSDLLHRVPALCGEGEAEAAIPRGGNVCVG